MQSSDCSRTGRLCTAAPRISAEAGSLVFVAAGFEGLHDLMIKLGVVWLGRWIHLLVNAEWGKHVGDKAGNEGLTSQENVKNKCTVCTATI